MCRRCRRPVVVCYCAALPQIETRTRVVILQHPRERDMPIGTARMASLCLPNAELHVGVRWDESPALAAALADLARPPVLLYPGPGAKDILREPPAGPVTLVVVDGTWSQAKTVVRDNPILHALPRYAFAAPEPSQYRIRKEPKAEYVSTIEALMYCLGALEGRPDEMRSLLAPLNAMVDAQLAAQAKAPQRFTRQVVKKKPPAPPPLALSSRWTDLVCMVAEANAWPYVGPDVVRTPDELVHLALQRPATGELLELVIAPRGELSPSAHFHTGLSPERLHAGIDRDGALALLRAFLRPTDIIGGWGHYSARLVHESGGWLPEHADWHLDVRAVAQRKLHQRLGSIEQFAASLGPVEQPRAQGRAGRRLAAMTSIAHRWRA